MALLIAG